MNGEAKGAEARVIVASLDPENHQAFRDFARLHGLDLAAAEPDVWMWSVAPAGSQDELASLPGWPRVFEGRLALCEALAEYLEDGILARERLAVAFLAGAPSTLSRNGLAFLAPLAGRLADNSQRPNLWTLAAFLSGPDDGELEAAGALLMPLHAAPAPGGGRKAEAAKPGFDTAVFLNPSAAGPVALTDDACRLALRATIDMARGGPNLKNPTQTLWRALRPEPRASRPRVMWLHVPGGMPSTETRPVRFRSAMADFFARSLEDATRPGAADAREVLKPIEETLRSIAPREEAEGATAGTGIDLKAAFPDGLSYRGQAIAAIDAGRAAAAKAFESYYDRQSQTLSDYRSRENASFGQKFETVQAMIAAYSVPGQGAGFRWRQRVDTQKKAIEAERARWLSLAEDARAALMRSQQAAQNTTAPTATGSLNLTALPQWRDFEAGAQDAKLAASRLKPDRSSGLWIAVPLFLTVAYAFLIFLMNPHTGTGFSLIDAIGQGMAQYQNGQFPTAPLVPVVMVFLFMLLAFAAYGLSDWSFRRNLKLALADLRAKGEVCRKLLKKALGLAQTIVTRAHSVLLASHFHDEIERIARDASLPKTLEECRKLKDGAPRQQVATEGGDSAFEKGIANRQIADDQRLLASFRLWRGQQPPDPVMALKIRRSDASGNFALNAKAEQEGEIEAPSSYASVALTIDVTPLDVLLADAGDGQPV